MRSAESEWPCSENKLTQRHEATKNSQEQLCGFVPLCAIFIVIGTRRSCDLL